MALIERSVPKRKVPDISLSLLFPFLFWFFNRLSLFTSLLLRISCVAFSGVWGCLVVCRGLVDWFISSRGVCVFCIVIAEQERGIFDFLILDPFGFLSPLLVFGSILLLFQLVYIGVHCRQSVSSYHLLLRT